jgi:hypothetical protein
MGTGLASESQYGVECDRLIVKTREDGILIMDALIQKPQRAIKGIA